jgi:hypothetical protein
MSDTLHFYYIPYYKVVVSIEGRSRGVKGVVFESNGTIHYLHTYEDVNREIGVGNVQEVVLCDDPQLFHPNVRHEFVESIRRTDGPTSVIRALEDDPDATIPGTSGDFWPFIH